jgi:hypothetical protein
MYTYVQARGPNVTALEFNGNNLNIGAANTTTNPTRGTTPISAMYAQIPSNRNPANSRANIPNTSNIKFAEWATKPPVVRASLETMRVASTSNGTQAAMLKNPSNVHPNDSSQPRAGSQSQGAYSNLAAGLIPGAAADNGPNNRYGQNNTGQSCQIQGGQSGGTASDMLSSIPNAPGISQAPSSQTGQTSFTMFSTPGGGGAGQMLSLSNGQNFPIMQPDSTKRNFPAKVPPYVRRAVRGVK